MDFPRSLAVVLACQTDLGQNLTVVVTVDQRRKLVVVETARVGQKLTFAVAVEAAEVDRMHLASQRGSVQTMSVMLYSHQMGLCSGLVELESLVVSHCSPAFLLGRKEMN